jgi:hypothetical protein
MIRKIITSGVTYGISYLPMASMLFTGGVQLQGQYAIQRYYFDLFVALLLLGVSQSIFKLANSIPLTTIVKLHKIASISLFLAIAVIVFFTKSDQAFILISISALFYSIGLVGRISLVISERVSQYQLMNALFPLALTLFPLVIYPKSEAQIIYFMLASAFISFFATSLLDLSIYKSPDKIITKEQLVNLGVQSWQALTFQLVQFSFPLVISLILLANGFGKNEIGLFSIAYATMSFVYAPATIFGPNIVSLMYKTKGKVSIKTIKYLTVTGFVASLSIIITIYFLKEVFHADLPYLNGLQIYVVATLPILALSRLVSPIMIWFGNHIKLIVCEISRFAVGALFYQLLTAGNYINFLIGLIVAEIAYLVIALHHFFGRQNRVDS